VSALTGTRYNPIIKAFYSRLVATVKLKKVALTAYIGKLWTILNAMLKKNEAGDPLYYRHVSSLVSKGSCYAKNIGQICLRTGGILF